MRIHILKPQKRRPQAGDRRITKKHGLEIRVQDMATGFGAGVGRPIGRVVRAGRPVFSWVKPQNLAPWDRHHLTDEERAKYFPPERELGYMQQRGAA